MFTLQFNFLPVEPLRVDDVYTDSASDSESEYETRGSSSIDGELHLLVLSYFVQYMQIVFTCLFVTKTCFMNPLICTSIDGPEEATEKVLEYNSTWHIISTAHG